MTCLIREAQKKGHRATSPQAARTLRDVRAGLMSFLNVAVRSIRVSWHFQRVGSDRPASAGSGESSTPEPDFVIMARIRGAEPGGGSSSVIAWRHARLVKIDESL